MAKVPQESVTLKSGKEVILRTALKEDAEALLDYLYILLNNCEGQVLTPGELNPTLAEEERILETHLNANRDIFMIATCEGKIIGSLNFGVGKRIRTAHTGEFGMAVHPEWRSGGVGKAIVQHLLDWASGVENLEKIKLRVLSDNQRAINLYKQFGFKSCGLRVNEIKYEPGKYVDELAMELRLDWV